MSKRNMVVSIICILIATASFFGGIAYQYDAYKPIVGFDYDTMKFTYNFMMPLDLETAFIWLDWAVVYHQFHIDRQLDDKPEFHQAYIFMYVQMKDLFLQFDEKWGINE